MLQSIRSAKFVLILAVIFLVIGQPSEAAESAPSEQPATASVRYRLDQPGQVSAAVYDGDGTLIRTLLRAQFQEPGEHTLHWDGLNRLGEPQPAGEYTVKLLRKPQFKREFVMQIGVNPNSKPYHRWVGDFGGGTSVAIDASGMYVSSRNAEGNYMLLKQSVDGTERMWARDDPDPWKGGLSLASDGETVYVLQQNAYITLFDAETGEHTGRWYVMPEEEIDPEKTRRDRRGQKYTDHSPLASLDLAVRGTTRVVSYFHKNRIRWLNDEGGTGAKITVPSPRAVAVAPNSTVYVVSGTKVLTVSRDGETENVITGLTNPRRLAYDPHRDHLLVAEGPDDWRVKRFSLSGKLVDTYGRRGGRQEGPYVAGDFKHYTDITADGRGGFFVAEPERPPRRVAHFDGEGELIREWYGGLNFFSWRSIDPRDPTQVWYKPSSGPSLVLAEVDYEAGTWSVKETYNPGNKAGGLARGGGNRGKYHVRYHDGERYLVGESFPPMVFHHHDGRIDPVVMGNRGRKFPQAGTVARLKLGTDDEEKVKAWIDDNLGKKRRQKNTYLWIDRNGDRAPQGEEITLHKLGNVYHGPGAGPFIGKDFSVIAGGGDYNPEGGEGATKFYTSIMRLKPHGWVEGVPQYRLPKTAPELDVAPMYVRPPTDAYIGRASVRHSFQDDEGGLYAFYHWGARGLSGFPNFQAGRYARLTKWTPDGRRLWSVGRKADGSTSSAIHWQPTEPGHIHYPTEVAGEVRGTIVVCDRVVNPGMAWTTDGLFAGSFFPGRVDDGLPGWVYAWQRDMESNRSALVNHDCLEGGAVTEHRGKVYFLSPGRNSIVVYRVHGYDRDRWTRMTRKVRIGEERPHATAEGNGLRAAFYSGMEITGEPDATQSGVMPAKLSVPEGVDTANGIAVRLTGHIEVPLSETFQFSVRGGATRMWVDGRQELELWNEDWRLGRHGGETSPLELRAGERVPIQIDIATTNPEPLTNRKKTSVALRWESLKTDPDDIPGSLMYPAEVDIAEEVDARPATGRILARSHDRTISSEGLQFDNFHRRHHIKNLSSGRHMGYRRIDFGDGVRKVRLNLRGSQGDGVRLELRLGAPDGRRLAAIEIPPRGIGYGKETILEANVAEVSGTHDLYLVGTGRRSPKIRWFTFE